MRDEVDQMIKEKTKLWLIKDMVDLAKEYGKGLRIIGRRGLEKSLNPLHYCLSLARREEICQLGVKGK